MAAQIRIKHLAEDVDRHGNVRIYVRRKGAKKVRIHAEKGTPKFWQEYHAALREAEPTLLAEADGTLGWLVNQYKRAAEFKRLKPRTRKIRERLLLRFCAAPMGSDGKPAGPKPFRYLEARHIRNWRDENCEKPEAANSVLKALRTLFAWAVEAGKAERNPARDVPYLRTQNPHGIHAWTLDEVDAFVQRHPVGTKAALALALLLFTGVRRSDVIGLGRHMERDGWLYFTEEKGENQIAKDRALPILAPLRQAIDACPSGHMVYLVTEFGGPFASGDSFANWFKKRCTEAGIPHCSPHGLRKAGATIAAEAGATEHQLMAMYGWESPKQAALYTKKANRKRLAGTGMELLVSHPAEQSVPPRKKIR